MRRPAPDEYADFYETYVSKVPDGDVVGFLRAQLDEALALFGDIPAERGDYCYEPGKWSIKQLLGHIVDTEWVFTYRALRFARGDETPLPGIEQNLLVEGGNFASRELADLIAEFRSIRTANLILFDSFDEAILDRRGTASGCSFTVRAQLFITAGHVQHHLGVLRERYLTAS